MRFTELDIKHKTQEKLRAQLEQQVWVVSLISTGVLHLRSVYMHMEGSACIWKALPASTSLTHPDE